LAISLIANFELFTLQFQTNCALYTPAYLHCLLTTQHNHKAARILTTLSVLIMTLVLQCLFWRDYILKQDGTSLTERAMRMLISDASTSYRSEKWQRGHKSGVKHWIGNLRQLKTSNICSYWYVLHCSWIIMCNMCRVVFRLLNNCWLPLLVASFHPCCSCTVVWIWCGM